ncbi:bile acid:sodium symporter family protein [Pedobacter hiemivivus]|uniref:Bile acid:sodium symporter family protein n=1 Tax=Pedobacter hiemivivus TaxID=2530454 RepID=A0A4R0NFP7_9SPHI|nr:bile acid:sodium symporter family protein [Pedobacter hiemivivus]TCC99329.1 bile acid:sodium symporter family protein [Pedobacter hiemivivus]TKC63823.1 bile acid:sodium symporter family protein [Pedobacter hiemivivus]
MYNFRRLCLLFALIAFVVLLVGLFRSDPALWQPAAVVMAVTVAIGIGALETLKNYQYTAWIITAVVAGMIYPAAFLKWGEFDLRNKWLILVVVQMVMFGMGIHMSLRDFTGLGSTGKGVVIGLLCHFTIMPLMGYMLTRVFHFETEIAAGIILIGSCSSGLASNVMVYIARANLVLSVAVTAMATLIAPFLTPLLMKLLAGTLIEIKFFNMMMEIIKIVIVPIGAALVHDYLKRATPKGWKRIKLIAAVCVLWLLTLPLGMWSGLERVFSTECMESVEILSFFAGAFLVGLIYHLFTLKFNNLDQLMPYISMFGIVYFTTVTTAAGRDNLLKVGFILFLASVIHNGAGYLFGYLLSRIFGLDKRSSRTVAFEVGLQNGGMASGLAGSMGKLGTVGLAAAVFSPWMNISGSILANYWRRQALKEEELEKSIQKIYEEA